jgi:hypothetical protein
MTDATAMMVMMTPATKDEAVMPTKVGIHDFLTARGKVVDADLRRHDAGTPRREASGRHALRN